MEKQRFSLSDLFYVLPLLFGLFMLGVMVFPFVLVALAFAQTGIPIEVILIMSSLIALALAIFALSRLFKMPLALKSRWSWGAMIILFPIAGPLIFLVYAQRRGNRPKLGLLADRA